MRWILSTDAAQEVTDAITEVVTDNFQLISKDMLIRYLQDSTPVVLDFLVKLILAVIVLLVGRRIIKFVRKIVRRFLDKRNWDTGVKQFFDHFVNVALHFILIMVVLGKFGITASSVIAIIGSAGLSIGLALQGTLANFAGGVLILLLKPFVVGDYIKEDTNNNEGFVKEIQLFYTKLQTYDNRIVILPNGDLSNCSLTNLTQQDKRRVEVVVGVSYHADLKLAKKILQEVIDREDKRLPEENNSVAVDSLGDSSVIMKVRVWVKTEDYWEVRGNLTENIKYALDENNIEIPFPQVTVSYEKKD